MNNLLVINVAALFFAVAGLTFAIWGAVPVVRRRASAGAALRMSFGLVLLGFSGALFWRFPQAARVLLAQDFEASSERLAELNQADLARTDDKADPPGEWPQWRGPRRDGVSTETSLLTSWPPAGPPELWRQPVGGGYSSPAVARGRVYLTDRVGDQERVLCLDADTGRQRWVYAYDAGYSGISYPLGPRATPTVHDGRVYSVGAAGVFLCLDAGPEADAPKLLWRHDLLSEFDAGLPTWGVACSPLVEGDLVIVQPGGAGGSVAAFDRRTGTRIWAALADPSGYSSPVAATASGVRQIVCFTGKGLTGLRPSDGGQLWYYAWPTLYNCNVATPIVAGDYAFLSSDYQSGCALLKLSPEGAGGVTAEPIYVRRDKLLRNHFFSSVLHDGHLYGFDTGGHGTGPTSLKCIDLRTAQEKWSSGRKVERGNLLYADGHLLVVSENGKLSLIEATPQAFKSKADAQILSGAQCWAAPALAGGRLYLRDGEKLVCLNLLK